MHFSPVIRFWSESLFSPFALYQSTSRIFQVLKSPNEDASFDIHIVDFLTKKIRRG